jgi:cation:H+ antiporter
MLVGLGLLAISAAVLIAGAELFTDNAAAAARRLQITLFAAAFLLAGAEPEEMITAVIASLRHRPELAAGDAIGANLTMLTLVLGVAALARPLPFGGRVRTYSVWSALAGGLAALTVFGGRIERWEGGLLVAAYAAGVALLWWREREPPAIGEAAEEEEEEEEEAKAEGRSRPAALGLALAVAGIALMAAGGWAAVRGAEQVVRAAGLSDSTVGLTLLALATTAELFALAWAAMRRGVSEIAVAGVIGSVAYNATATLGVAALVRPLAVTGILVPAIAAAILPVALLTVTPRRQLTRPAGVVLVIGYAAWVTAVLAR